MTAHGFSRQPKVLWIAGVAVLADGMPAVAQQKMLSLAPPMAVEANGNHSVCDVRGTKRLGKLASVDQALAAHGVLLLELRQQRPPRHGPASDSTAPARLEKIVYESARGTGIQLEC